MMLKLLAKFAASRLDRWSAAFAVAGLSAALLGAEPVGEVTSVRHRTTTHQVKPTVNVATNSDELLHDAPIAPTNNAVVLTTAATPAASAGRKSRVISMQVTAYCPCKRCCGPSAQGLTASGRPITYNGGRFVAADTRLLPFNTKLVIPGYANEKAVEVVDRGGAIKGNHIDLFFPTHQQAREWGVRTMQVTVIE